MFSKNAKRENSENEKLVFNENAKRKFSENEISVFDENAKCEFVKPRKNAGKLHEKKHVFSGIYTRKTRESPPKSPNRAPNAPNPTIDRKIHAKTPPNHHRTDDGQIRQYPQTRNPDPPE